jgi:Periplasmic binding protein-like domain
MQHGLHVCNLMHHDPRSIELRGQRSGLRTSVLPSEPIVSLDVSFHPSWTQCFFRIDSPRLMPLDTSLEHGYKAVACVTARPRTYRCRERMDGYSAEMISRGLPSRMIVAQEYPELDDMLREALSSESRPEALLALSDITVLHIMKLFQELRLSPKQRPKMIGFDDFELAAFLDVPLTRYDRCGHEFALALDQRGYLSGNPNAFNAGSVDYPKLVRL